MKTVYPRTYNTKESKSTIAALMNAPDVLSTFPRLIPEGHLWQPRVPARLVLQLPFLRPGSYTSEIECPILFGICGKDSVAPAGVTLAYAKAAPKGVIKWYADVGHFDIYFGQAFEQAMQDYKQFLLDCLPV